MDSLRTSARFTKAFGGRNLRSSFRSAWMGSSGPATFAMSTSIEERAGAPRALEMWGPDRGPHIQRLRLRFQAGGLDRPFLPDAVLARFRHHEDRDQEHHRRHR